MRALAAKSSALLCAAHSGPSGHSAHYPPPALLQSKKPERLSQVIATGPSSFEVVGLLKAQGRTQGALVVRLSTRQLAGRVRSDLAGVFGAILLALLLSGLVVLLYGRNVLNRLVHLRRSVLALGHVDQLSQLPRRAATRLPV
jgi:hypothetical protein